MHLVIPTGARVPVVVLTTNAHPFVHAPLAVARSLGRIGVRVYVAHPGPPLPLDRSRHLAGRFAVTHDPADPDRLTHSLERIGRWLREPAILVALDDVTALHVDEYAESLSRWFRFPGRPHGLAASLASKRELYRLCERSGVPTVHTDFPSRRQDVVDHAAAARYPIVVKIIDPSLRPTGAPRVCVTFSAAELVAAYDRLCGEGEPNVMLQEYLPGEPDSTWMFNGYFDRNSHCLLAFTGTKLRQYPLDTGPTSLGVCRSNIQVQTMAIDLLSRLGYTGIVDLDYRFDARDQQYKLLDVNPHVSGCFRLFVGGNGIDVVRAFYLDFTGQQVPRTHARQGRRWLDEPRDLYASLRCGRRGPLSLAQWFGSLVGVREGAWFAADDPVPVLAMLPSAARTLLSIAGDQNRTARSGGGTTERGGRPDQRPGRWPRSASPTGSRK